MQPGVRPTEWRRPDGPVWVQAARETLASPWVHQGRIVGTGIDCIGLLVYVAGRLGMPHEDCRSYGMRPDGEMLLHYMRMHGVEVSLAEAQLGDVVVFWVERKDRPTHCGIITEKGIIHTNRRIGRVVEHGWAPHSPQDEWHGKLHSIWRFVGKRK